jgi:periplasmic protein TonB
MSMSALSWHDERNPRELARWAIAGAVVLSVHAGALIYLLTEHEPDIVGSNMDAVTVELAPIDSTPDAVEQDVAPAPETMVESAPLPDAPQPKPQEEMKVLVLPPDFPSMIEMTSPRQ